MAEDKKSFVLYTDLIHTVNKLPDEVAGRLFKHTLAYVNDLQPETNELLIEVTFEPIKQQLKRDLIKYEARRQRNRENGAKGGRPEKPKETEKKPKKAKKPSGLNLTEIGIDPIKYEIFSKWLNYRNEIKKPIKVKSTIESLIKKFESTELLVCEQVVNSSIENNYQGLFWDKFQPKKEVKKTASNEWNNLINING